MWARLEQEEAGVRETGEEAAAAGSMRADVCFHMSSFTAGIVCDVLGDALRNLSYKVICSNGVYLQLFKSEKSACWKTESSCKYHVRSPDVS